jgi:hypothetical protein
MVGNEEVHPVVRLLLERMKSHPEEFEPMRYDENIEADDARYRWGRIIEEVQEFGSDADAEALECALRDIRLGRAHEWALDELLNGEERRAQVRREREEQEKQRFALMQQAYAQAQKPALQSYQNGLLQSTTQQVPIQNGGHQRHFSHEAP